MPTKSKMDVNSKKQKMGKSKMPNAKTGKGTKKSTSYKPRNKVNSK